VVSPAAEAGTLGGNAYFPVARGSISKKTAEREKGFTPGEIFWGRDRRQREAAITDGPPQVHDLACCPVCYFGKVAITAGLVEARPVSSPFANTLPSSAVITAEPVNAPVRLRDGTLTA
jgi:hypothetical protein